MAKKITGVAIAPGVSKNGKRYTRASIGRAVARMQARIAEGSHPIVMRTHHGAGDDSTAIVARLVGVRQEPDGSAIYEAVTQNTTAGRDIEAMVADKALAHVSIWGGWVGKPKKTLEGGRWIEEADDFEIDKLDFTASPGVFGTTATVESWEPTLDPGVLAESVRPVMFSDYVEAPLAEAVAAPSLVSVSISGCIGGFDLSVCAWGVPTEEVDAWADTAQRAFAAASSICSAAPVDDDDAMESHELSADLTESNTEKEPTMGEATEATKAEEIAESTQAPLTAAGIAEALVAALKGAGVISETAPVTETDTSTTTTAAAETAPAAVAGLSEADLAKIRADVLASIVANGEVKPTRKGFGLAETSDINADAAYSWENRGDELAKAFGIGAGIDVDPAGDAGAA